MLNKIKKIFVISISSVLLITQPITICQAKLKPGQFNKEMLKWIEPYKERDDIPDSWTWYPEYDREENDGELPEGAVITNEYYEDTKDCFYDEYWVNGVLWGGMNQVYHNKNIGFTKPMLGIIGHFSDKDRVESAGNPFTTDKNGNLVQKSEKVEGNFISRQVSKSIEMYAGKIDAGIVARIEEYKGKIMDINIYITFYYNTEKGGTFVITDEYLNDFNNFTYDSLEKALNKFSKVCYNYNSYIGSNRVIYVPNDGGTYDTFCAPQWVYDKSLYSKKVNDLFSNFEELKSGLLGSGLKVLHLYSKAYSNEY